MKNLKQVAKQRIKLASKYRVKDKQPGAIIKKLNKLPKANTKAGLAIRGLI